MSDTIFDMKKCKLCPRNCGANRSVGEKGVCGETEQIRLARVSLHMWEEPCITGVHGSGTVFFSGCAMHCVFCQNQEIANDRVGWPVSEERLAEIFLEQQERKASNINLVTAGHYLPGVARALQVAKAQGLCIPVVYNSGGYEKAEALHQLEGLVDVWLPDFKYMDPKLGARYSHAAEYSTIAKTALAEMVRQSPKPVFEDDLMKKGVIVRHLLLPGQLEDSKRILSYIYETYGDDVYISIMNQYTPVVQNAEQYPELGRRVTEDEYEELVDYAIALGIENGFVQEGDTAEESFIPDFNGQWIEASVKFYSDNGI